MQKVGLCQSFCCWCAPPSFFQAFSCFPWGSWGSPLGLPVVEGRRESFAGYREGEDIVDDACWRAAWTRDGEVFVDGEWWRSALDDALG